MNAFDPRPPSQAQRDPTGAPIREAPGGSPENRLPEPDSPDRLPADPEAYDSPRASQARARGLAAPYIAGGDDPDPARGRAEERRLGLLLIAMIVAVVLAGFVLGIIQNILGL